jgi:hypothetical protein
MWLVVEECMVYGENNIAEFKTKEDAEEYYCARLKDSDYLMGYINLYLTEIIHNDCRELLDDEKYYYDIDKTEYKYIPSKKLKFLVLQDFDCSLSIAKKGYIGFLTWHRGDTLEINGCFSMIIENKGFDMVCSSWTLNESGKRDRRVNNDQLIRLLTKEEDQKIRESIQNGRTEKFYEVLNKY